MQMINSPINLRQSQRPQLATLLRKPRPQPIFQNWKPTYLFTTFHFMKLFHSTRNTTWSTNTPPLSSTIPTIATNPVNFFLTLFLLSSKYNLIFITLNWVYSASGVLFEKVFSFVIVGRRWSVLVGWVGVKSCVCCCCCWCWWWVMEWQWLCWRETRDRKRKHLCYMLCFLLVWMMTHKKTSTQVIVYWIEWKIVNNWIGLLSLKKKLNWSPF